MGLLLVLLCMYVYKDLIQCKLVCDIKQGIDPCPLLARPCDRWWLDLSKNNNNLSKKIVWGYGHFKFQVVLLCQIFREDFRPTWWINRWSAYTCWIIVSRLHAASFEATSLSCVRERKHLYIDTLNLVYGLRADINYFLLGNLLFRLDFHRCLEPGLPSPRGEFGVTGGGEVGGSTGSFPKQRLIIKPTWPAIRHFFSDLHTFAQMKSWEQVIHLARKKMKKKERKIHLLPSGEKVDVWT